MQFKYFQPGVARRKQGRQVSDLSFEGFHPFREGAALAGMIGFLETAEELVP